MNKLDEFIELLNHYHNIKKAKEYVYIPELVKMKIDIINEIIKFAKEKL